ncbi:MAG: hypothetical protein LBT32_03215 [Peptococcaceae bacterium]|nr:hypothetical protein [Peptococcaceae bacterium]
MSMPTITIGDIDLNQAMNNVIASIALEEAALSHLLNAEGEKLQAVIGMADVSVDQLREINATIVEIISGIAAIEESLQAKLNALLPPVNTLDELAAISPNIAFGIGPARAATLDFRKNLFSVGTAISHVDNSTNILIHQAGTYQIVYQVFVDNPAHTSGAAVSMDIGLSGTKSGTLASSSATVTGEMLVNSIEASLPEGEVLSMEASGPGTSEVIGVAPAIYIKKIS